MFLQFKHQREHNGKPLHWGRVSDDLAPYLGTPPLMNPQELEAKSERVEHFHFGIFDISQPNQRRFGRTYREVIEGACCGWFKLLFKERKWAVSRKTGRLTVLWYVEWSEPYMMYRGTPE